MGKGRFHLAVATGFALALIGNCGCGGGERQAPTELSAEQREELRQKHIELSERELSEK
ncbi:MAG: hypothetical protein L0228_11690 [Planctomycetes bacterium]|nr:hypothetical protein [Planctomycetota bacterium]